MSLSTEIRNTWDQQVSFAKAAWSKLREDELMGTFGEVQKLAGLVHERYWVTRDQAEEQVNNFIQKFKH
ncbi:MAG: general stress protein CsbD [Alcaligenaceae bacterium]|nr:MAG: general stress protein CsbD [Alcaligenaceae bacterium]